MLTRARDNYHRRFSCLVSADSLSMSHLDHDRTRPGCTAPLRSLAGNRRGPLADGWPLAVPAVLSMGFLWLWPHLFYADAFGIHGAFRTLWADFSAHLTFAQRFASAPPALWFQHHPLYYGLHFDYPFVSGLISGLLLRLTGSEVAALLIPTIVATVALPWLIYLLVRTAGITAAWAAAGTLVFYLGGGLGWTSFLSAGFDKPPELEASMVQGTLFQFGRLVHLLLPQRALQLGLPIGLLVIILLTRIKESLAEGQSGGLCAVAIFGGGAAVLAQILLGCLAGLLMAVHVHSFLAVVVATATLVLIAAVPYPAWATEGGHPRGLQRLLGFLPFAATALLVSLSLYWGFVGGMRHGFLQFHPGWLANDFWHWLGLWWSNAGVFYLAAIYVLFTRRLWQRPLAGTFAVAGWLLFASVNLISFQPWDWDNTKLEIWAYLLLIPSVMLLFESWWTVPRARRAAFLVVLSLFPTGILDLGQVLAYQRNTHPMWSTDQRVLARRLKGMLQPGDVVLVADRPHEWVSALAGGQILLGYTGWVWSYGIDPTQRQQEIRALFQGGEGAMELLQRYRIRWAVIDDEARRVYGANEAFYADHFQVVLQQGGTRVYDLQSPIPALP